MSSYLTAGLALLLCVDVDRRLVDAGEGVVPRIVSVVKTVGINFLVICETTEG